jgi:hypothetical protein
LRLERSPGSETANTEEEERDEQPLLNLFWSLRMTPWNPTDHVLDTLFHHAEQGMYTNEIQFPKWVLG